MNTIPQRGLRARLLSLLLGALAAVALLVPASPVVADPRWWWDDAPVGSVAPVSDVDVAVIAEPGLPLVIFVAWVEPPTLIEGSLRLTASFDGGCSFCPPVHLQSLFGPDDDIALAAAAFEGIVPTAAVAIVHAAAGNVQVLHEAGSIPLTGVADCRSLQDLALGLSRTELARGDADQPDVAGVADIASGMTQFHAVWHQVAPTDEEWIVHARDLGGDGAGWEVLGMLPTSAGLFARQADPHLSLDLFASGDAAVNVAWSVPDFNQVLYLRSVDSGTTFSATGELPESPPAVVAQAGLGAAGPVAIDSGGSPEPLDPPWHGVALFQDRGPAALVVFDAQHQQAPTVPGPEWGADQVVSSGAAFREDGLAVSVLPGGPSGEPQPAWMFWTGAVAAAGREVIVRGGVLDSDAAVSVELNAPPIPPARAGDPTVSTSALLTHCRVDPVSFDCVSDRRSGTARRAASADGRGEVFVAWIDDREGTAAVWFKRTDRVVAAPQPSLSASCPAPGEPRITVSFDQLPRCSSTPEVSERIRRYLVYYGTTAGGPYENTDLDGSDPGVPDTILIVDDGTLVDPVSVDIDSLAVGVVYHVLVVPEDEAGNLFPADLDPLVGRGASPANEASISTPSDCGPPGPCLYRATAESLDPSGLFVSPRGPDDIAFAPPHDLPYGPCPFASGDPDPEPVLEASAPPLIYYQVEGAGLELHVAAEPALGTVRLSFF